MKIGNFNIGKGLVWAVIIGAVVLFFASTLISFKNAAARNGNEFKQENTNRTSAYDEMWKTFAGKANLTTDAKKGFMDVVKLQMDGNKDAEGLAMKWIKQANPSAGYTDIVDLYKDLSRTIESKRALFQEREARLASLVKQRDDMITQFPGSLWASILGVGPLEYKPITSDRTDEVIKTGKDNDVDLFKNN